VITCSFGANTLQLFCIQEGEEDLGTIGDALSPGDVGIKDVLSVLWKREKPQKKEETLGETVSLHFLRKRATEGRRMDKRRIDGVEG